MANIITTCRIVLSLLLIECPVFSKSFYWLYFAAGITDILDGIAARLLKQETVFGARLDTVADIVFFAVAAYKVLPKISISPVLWIWVCAIAFIKIFNIISGIVLSGHFVSEHTFLNKTSGVILFSVPFCIGIIPEQSMNLLIVFLCGLTTVAAIQECCFIHTGRKVE